MKRSVLLTAPRCAVLLLLAGTLSVLPGTSLAADVGLTAVGVTAGIGDTSVLPKIGQPFYKAKFTINYSGSGTVVLSANPDGTGHTVVDDVMTIQVNSHKFIHDYTNDCRTGLVPLGPQDLTSLFKVGLNKVTVTLKDKCGIGVASDPLWITVQP